jgi:hypothetical protein
MNSTYGSGAATTLVRGAGRCSKNWLEKDAAARAALLRLLEVLEARSYDFIAPTPASQQRVLSRAEHRSGDPIADLLGWSLPCRLDQIDDIAELLVRADVLVRCTDGSVRATIRVSRVFENLFIHSAFPTEAQDSVFLGPDSHRFADFILRNLDEVPASPRVVDYGAGAGVGGITAAAKLEQAVLTLADLNPLALALASINAEHGGVRYETVHVGAPGDLEPGIDLILMHPPFMIDPARRAYRDGGDLYGGRLSVDWLLAGIEKLAPGGRLVMHTGVSIVEGRDLVHEALQEALPPHGLKLDYRLLDPDIYGDELESPAYAGVDRIAAVGACVVLDRHRHLRRAR